MPLLQTALVAASLLSAQDILGTIKEAAKAVGLGADSTPTPEQRKRMMFDASCAAEVDLESEGQAGAHIAHQDQEDFGNCWAYAGCYAIDAHRRSRPGVSQADVPPCDPMLTSVAVKLASKQPLWDNVKDGARQGTFVDSDNSSLVPANLKTSTFGRLDGFCGKEGCFCVRATDHDVSGPQLVRAFYRAKDITEAHMKKVVERRARKLNIHIAGAAPAADARYDDPEQTALLIAKDLDAAKLPGIIRSALDDVKLAQMAREARKGGVLDNRAYARAILEQSCLPQAVPSLKVAYGPEGVSDDDRARMFHSPLFAREKMTGLFDWINGRLASSKPVLLNFCSSLLDYKDPADPAAGDYLGVPPVPIVSPHPTPAPRTSSPGGGECGAHAVVITGRKLIDGKCHYQIRNSWGSGKRANPELRYGVNPGASVWVPAYLLLQNTFQVAAFE